MDLHSDYPFWMIKEGVIRTFPSLRENHQRQIVIIGGGVTGALLAYRCVKEGLQVSVLEKRHVAHGSSSASTALLQYEIDVPLFKLIEDKGVEHAERAYQLCSGAIDTLEQICHQFPDRADFERCESVLFSSFEKHVKEIMNPEFEARKKAGFKVELLDRGALNECYGFTAPAGILSRQAAKLNPYKLSHFLLEEVTKMGGQVFDSTEVSEFQADEKGVHLRTNEGFEIEAEHLIIACGYESQKYVSKKVTQLNSSYALVSKPYSKLPLKRPDALLWETKTPYLYLRTTADGRIMIGGRDELFYDPDKRDSLLPAKKLQLIRDFNVLFPEIELEVDFAWAGTFAETADGLPYIGTFDAPNVHFAMGYGGNGITFSVIAAQIICDEIKGNSNQDRQLFSFDRDA